MKPILPPTHVGDLNWPVVSYLRLDTGDTPAEFFVLVDCGEGTPNEPYATMRVLVWPDHSKTEWGEYDLTFAQAQHSLIERAGLTSTSTVEIVTVRDPDGSSDHAVFIDGVACPDRRSQRVRVVVHDLDIAADTITPAWVADQIGRTRNLSADAATYARIAVTMYADDNVDPS